MKIVLLLLSFQFIGIASMHAKPLQAIHPQPENVVVAEVQPKKQKFRWKRIFRPIRVFTKKVPFWMLWATLLALFGRCMLEYEESYSSNFLDYTLVGMVLLGAAVVAIAILLCPIIFTIRVIQELKWRRRYRKCDY